MTGLIDEVGQYRHGGVGVMSGDRVVHMAPPANQINRLMIDLLDWLNESDVHPLIQSSVFHYEFEFIHPFADGNGQMGRLWQTLILMTEYPVFELLPFETLISKTQNEYYKSLALSDKSGKSTYFIEYMLEVIDKSLENLLSYNNRILKDIDRLEYFLTLGINDFNRKDYMNVFKDLSSATASRDLKKGVEMNLFESVGNLNKTKYITK